VARYPEIAQRIVEGGHEIYSHSYSHSVFINLDEAAIIAELPRTEAVLSRLRPTPNPYPIRLPGGMGWDRPHVHRAIRHWKPEAVIVHWTVNSGDWAARASIGLRGDPQREARVRTCETALDPALGGAIVLAHDCLIGVPRTSTDYIRCFFDGLADVVSDAHLIAAPCSRHRACRKRRHPQWRNWQRKRRQGPHHRRIRRRQALRGKIRSTSFVSLIRIGRPSHQHTN
jgi:hypothetical protein